MSKLTAKTEDQQERVCKLGNGASIWVDTAAGDGAHIDDFITFDAMAAIVDYLRSQQVAQYVGSEFDNEWLNVGDTVQVFTDRGMFFGRVNHVDSRDVLIVMDYQCSRPAPSIAKPLGNMQVGGDHYQTKIQPVEYIHANGLPFIEGNVVKYISRHKAKGGADDIEKAISYCKMLLKLDYGYTDEQIGKLFEK